MGFDKVKRDDFVQEIMNNDSFYINYDHFNQNSKDYWFFLLHKAFQTRDPMSIGHMRRRVAKLFNNKMPKYQKIRY